jgi:hypothetical protein
MPSAPELSRKANVEPGRVDGVAPAHLGEVVRLDSINDDTPLLRGHGDDAIVRPGAGMEKVVAW